MFDADAKTIKRMWPMIQRVLIIDAHAPGARMVGELMRSVGSGQVWIADSTERGLRFAQTYDPHIIFVERSGPDMNGLEFARKLRRSHLPCRYAPIIMVTSQATAGGILAARDAGIHEFLRKPFTMKDLLRRLEAVTLRQRDWVEAVEYVGPDRRRFNSGDYAGALKRRSDVTATPDSERMSQALKILRSAIAAVTIDPPQAMRSMQAQVAELRKCGMAVADLKLTTAAIDLGRYLDDAEQAGPPYDRETLETRAAPLLAYIPKDESAAVAA